MGLVLQVSDKNAELRAAYAQLLSRVDNPKRGDQERLAQLTEALGITPERFELDKTIVAEWRRLKAIVDQLEDIRNRWDQAVKAWNRLCCEATEFLYQNQLRQEEAQQTQTKYYCALNEASAAREFLGGLYEQFPEVLGPRPNDIPRGSYEVANAAVQAVQRRLGIELDPKIYPPEPVERVR